MLREVYFGRRVRASIVLLVLLFYIAPARAQYFTIDSSRNHVTIPFLFVRDLVVIQLQINKTGPYNFILDSGVGQMVITDPSLGDLITNITKHTIKISGFGEGQDYEADVTSALNVKIDGLTSHYVTAAMLKKDFFGLSSYAGMPIHGLLGYAFFSKLAVKVDFADSTVTVYRPGKFLGFANGTKIPLSIEDNRPYIQTKITRDNGIETDEKMIVDLGGGHAVTLENVVNKADFSPKVISGNLGVGIRGTISGSIGRIKELELGKYKLKDLIASYPDDDFTSALAVHRDGNLGMQVLKRFKLVFDYSNEALYIKSSYGFSDLFEHDMTGIEYYTNGPNLKHVMIGRIEPGSPAEEAGLEKDDEIVAINLKPVANMSVQEIDNIFRSKDKRSILLEIYHDQHFSTIVTLRRRI
jgi:hypothetical protein